jgi:D-proline reductase (dithiol) PrdB
MTEDTQLATSSPLPRALPRPFSFKDMMQEISGREPSPAVDFEPPAMTRVDKPLEESTIGVFASCGVYHADQKPFEVTNDLSYRLISREIPLDDLILGHQAAIRHFALQDLNVAYPRDRMIELEAAGVFGRLADNAVSMVGAISTQERLLLETVPAIADDFESQGVDLVLLLPFCPACHTTVPLIARALENRGLPTIMTSCLWERLYEYKPPRTAFLDFPLGCPAGKPNDPAKQRDVLTRALRAADQFQDTWGIVELPIAWTEDGRGGWEEEVRALYVADAEGLVRRADALTGKRGELAGQEKEFAIRCAC